MKSETKNLRYLLQTSQPDNMTQEDPEKRRKFVIAEIVSTEKVYFGKLQALMEVFIIPLEPLRLISSVDYSLQFDGFKLIYDVHKTMSEILIRESEEQTLNVGNLFSTFSESLGNYKDYLVNYEEAIIRRGVLLTKNKAFANFFEKAMSHPSCLGK
jgi:hypothetical protein